MQHQYDPVTEAPREQARYIFEDEAQTAEHVDDHHIDPLPAPDECANHVAEATRAAERDDTAMMWWPADASRLARN